MHRASSPPSPAPRGAPVRRGPCVAAPRHRTLLLLSAPAFAASLCAFSATARRAHHRSRCRWRPPWCQAACLVQSQVASVPARHLPRLLRLRHQCCICRYSVTSFVEATQNPVPQYEGIQQLYVAYKIRVDLGGITIILLTTGVAVAASPRCSL